MKKIIILLISTGYLLLSSFMGETAIKNKDNIKLTNEITETICISEYEENNINEEIFESTVEEKKQDEIKVDNIQENISSENTKIEEKNVTVNTILLDESSTTTSKPVENPEIVSKNVSQLQQPTEQINTESKTNDEKEIITPLKQEPIYCVDGGKIHIYGDDVNEHGYYNTWDEAFKAYEEYTIGWESTQFKIDQCACGLYYFWVTR